MATNYKGYTQAQYDNQSKYLNNLINSGSSGQAAWAQKELASLNSQYTPSASTTPSTGGSTQTQAQINASVNNSTGKTGTSGSNKYGTSYKYSGGKEYTSTDGGKTYADSSGNTIGSNSTAQSSAGLTSGWNNVGTGASGKTFETYGATGSILVNYSDGSYRIVNPTDSDYLVTREAMTKDLAGNGINYTPSKTWSVTQDIYKMDGSGDIDYTQDVAYTRKDYLTGNNDLKYALEQAMKANGTNTYDIEGYVKSLYDRIGSTNAAGTGLVTLDDVNRELGRLGLSDYNSSNAIYTAGGTILPNNQYVTNKTGSFGGTNSADSTWASYAGQDYLIGGDSANFVDYVNGKTGNITASDLVFNNMANNPYAQQDPAFMNQYYQNLNGFNNAAGITPSTSQGSYTGNVNVDNIINYGNSLGNYNQATGGSLGTVNLLEMLQSYLNSGLQANQDFLAQQRAMAEEQAQRQASDAYVNKVLAGDAMQQQLSALGLGTSGALQSAQMGIQGNYGNNLADIQQNLYAMLNGLSEQELGILTDYYNNMANYAYDVTQYEADQAYRNAQLALQQQQAIYDEAYRRQQQLLQQQQWEYEKAMSDKAWDFEQKKYEDELAEKLNKSSAKKSSGGSVSGGGNTASVYGDTGNAVTGVPMVIPQQGVTAPEVNSAEWRALLDDAALKQQIGLDYLDELSNVSMASAPSANTGQLAQQAMDAYNNAMASVPTGTVNQSELLRQLKQAISMVENGYY